MPDTNQDFMSGSAENPSVSNQFAAADLDSNSKPAARLRLWPGILAVVLMWILLKVPAMLVPGGAVHFIGMMSAPYVGVLGCMIWWLFFSRIPWRDRILGLVLPAIFGAISYPFYDHSMNFMGMIFTVLPILVTAWVAWLVISQPMAWSKRVAGVYVVFFFGFAFFGLVRVDGLDGSFSVEMSPRWEPTAEQAFLAQANGGTTPKVDPATASPNKLVLQAGDWPSFRGPRRDGILTGTQINTDWKSAPPKQRWKHRVGPGWSSFAVVGNHVYTQEQRDTNECVVCYDSETGAEIWSHNDKARFYEVVAGAGPRATPTFHEGKIYAMGAEGHLNCLDAASGKKIWGHNILDDIRKEPGSEEKKLEAPMWGYAASPTILQNIVAVYSGFKDQAVLGYALETGKLVWAQGNGSFSYCTLQPAKIEGVEQFVICTDRGLSSYEPATGNILWEFVWQPGKEMARVVQPLMIGNSDFLLGTGFGFGTKRVNVSHEKAEWATKEVWTTQAIKPYYNDMVAHKDNLYGFDGMFFNSVTLKDGKLNWKVRGYGSGQVLLIADQDLLLILSETGDVALVKATPEKHIELAKFHALNGKTWNHPVVANGRLFIRNGAEAACYDLCEPPQPVTKSGSGS